jgi:hypothetical protein
MTRDQLDRRREHMSHSETEGAALSPETETSTDTPGDAAGVVVPNEHAMPGTSEEFSKADGVLVYPEADQPE